jgi:pimeloyl-ACP methyl ester carboxylesterase
MNAIALNHPKLTKEERPEPAVEALAGITAPVLLIVGSLDYPDIIELHDELSESIENAFAVILDDTAHLPSLERPDLFDPLLLEFLEAVTGEKEDE